MLEEDGEMQSSVTFAVRDGRIRAVPHQLDHHGEVALPRGAEDKQTALKEALALPFNGTRQRNIFSVKRQCYICLKNGICKEHKDLEIKEMQTRRCV